MAGGWLNLESATSVIPETQFFEGDSAFKSLGLSRTTRLYGFIGWYVFVFSDMEPCLRAGLQFGHWFRSELAGRHRPILPTTGYLCWCVLSCRSPLLRS